MMSKVNWAIKQTVRNKIGNNPDDENTERVT